MTETGFTTRKIIAWLRNYYDWVSEVEDQDHGSPSLTDYSRPRVQSSPSEDPAARLIERRDELQKRIVIVEGWLAILSPVERQAARYWMRDKDGSVTDVAHSLGVEFRQARILVDAIPMVIWARFYQTSHNAG